MSVEELVLAAEFRQKELDPAGAAVLLNKALERDPGYSRAHLLLGIDDFTGRRYESAVAQLEKAIARDPYADEAYYYLAMAQFALGRDAASRAEPVLTSGLTAPTSANASITWAAWRCARATTPMRFRHLERAIAANGYDLLSRQTLALALRERGAAEQAAKALDEIERIDPTNRIVFAERWLLTGSDSAKAELVRLLGGQSQEAIGTSVFYRRLERWKEAVQVLQLAQRENHDPWGTPPEFFYTLAYCQRRAGDERGRGRVVAKRHARRRATSTASRTARRAKQPLAEAVRLQPKDSVARFGLACLLYYQRAAQGSHRAMERRDRCQSGGLFRAPRAWAWRSPNRAPMWNSRRLNWSVPWS